ncbi:hypothetical protein TTHERM_00382100 (macronuclear) [Tetrahymena thermophila SB210]|uniref:Uncharacterized protein n=1 Tax=Tetrahymena thermophila (strain SB210) TaxID=312017 RepID=Q23FA4_TETTS|nr:hypothetical protein TTHERM_00382100 [Tetrahymena thermophila SB210]EAR95249.2 hypothetical protein TTHERM_00382100 [Tetrahymena thermophila SB210]|eukprot:XP_001015494.2 hypothetical protein TTHERM_00382100 [Tetrahymena thermophila SB210]
MNANQARSYRQKRRDIGNFEEYGEDNDEEFVKNAGETIKRAEEDQKVKKIQNQINYFGYMIEPLNMKNEREEKEIDEEGNYRFSWKREKENSDAWLSQLDEDQYGFKMYFNSKQEKGVYSDDDENDKGSDEEIEEKQKKFKRNNEDIKGKFEDSDILSLSKELVQILEEGQKEITDIMIVITPKIRIDQINEKLKKNEKPVFPFKKNIRQKEKEEQENKIKEWESNKISQEEEIRIKNMSNDLIEIIKELEIKLHTATLWEKDLDFFKEMMQKEEAKLAKQNQNKGGDEEEEENVAEEDDLKLIPKQLLDKLNAGTLTEDEEDEVRRLIMMARMRRNRKDSSSSSEEELRTGNLQFDDSDPEEEDEESKKAQQNEVKVPISQQNNPQKQPQQQQFKAPNPVVRRNSQPEINNVLQNQPKPIPTVALPPQQIVAELQKITQRVINQPIEEEEIPDSKPVSKPAPKTQNRYKDEDDEFDIFN